LPPLSTGGADGQYGHGVDDERGVGAGAGVNRQITPSRSQHQHQPQQQHSLRPSSRSGPILRAYTPQYSNVYNEKYGNVYESASAIENPSQVPTSRSRAHSHADDPPNRGSNPYAAASTPSGAGTGVSTSVGITSPASPVAVPSLPLSSLADGAAGGGTGSISARLRLLRSRPGSTSNGETTPR
jgi:hypothetical protein